MSARTRARSGFAWLAAVSMTLLACGAPAPTAPARRPPAPAVPKPVVAQSPPPPPVPAAAPEPSCTPLRVEPFELTRAADDPAPVAIVRGDRLAPFYTRVARLLRGRADDHIRIAVYGDSNLAADYQTGQLRRRLQGRFGDAGHGLVSVGEPWWAYDHMDVEHGSRGWVCHNVSTDPVIDKLYGLTGIAAESGPNAREAFVATAGPDAPVGRSVDAFEVFYLARPSARFDVRLDAHPPLAVMAEPEPSSILGVHRVDTSDGPHRLELRPTSVVRVFGVALERKQAPPSFIVDSFGVGAMNSRAQASKDPALETAMLRARGYDLVIFHTGHNDGFTWQETPAALRALVALHREALPDAPILLMTPADRGKDDTFRFTRIAVEQRRELAAELDTALWDLWEAMGGRRSMARFKTRGLARSDYIHFNERGGAWVGDRLLEALWADLARYAAANPELGCDDEEEQPQRDKLRAVSTSLSISAR